MIEETIAKIEAHLSQASAVSPEKRAELLSLLTTLRAEVTELAPNHSSAARSIAEQTEQSTVAATAGEREAGELEQSLEGLSASVTEFEESHPKLVQVVNRICETLASLGI